MTTVSKNAKFTPEQETAIRNAAPVNQAVARELAEQLGLKEKSIIAKATRMGVYVRKQPTTKTGAPVERKEAIVADLAELLNANLDGLEKAPKPVLQLLRDFARG